MFEDLLHALAPVVLTAGLVAGVVVLVVSLRGLGAERRSMRVSLAQVDDMYDLANIPVDDLALKPLGERALMAARAVLVRLGRRVSPVDYVNRVRELVVRAGQPEGGAVDRFIARRLLGFVAAPVLFAVAYKTMPASPTLKLAAAVLATVAVVVLPKAKLNSAVSDREARIRKSLPSVLDLLVVCVEAGLGFSSALTRAVAAVPGELSKEFAVALGELRAGASRSDAMRRLATRVQLPEIRALVGALHQADELGVPIAPVLRQQADDMRVRRRQLAQERAQKAPVKMLVPMVFCIFPPLFMVVIGPAVLQMVYGGGLS